MAYFPRLSYSNIVNGNGIAREGLERRDKGYGKWLIHKQGFALLWRTNGLTGFENFREDHEPGRRILTSMTLIERGESWNNSWMYLVAGSDFN